MGRLDSGGQLILRDSTLNNYRIYLKATESDCYLERNVLINAEMQVSRFSDRESKIYIKNNFFYNPQWPVFTGPGHGIIQIGSGSSLIEIENNSFFLNTNMVAVELFNYLGCDSDISVKNNFWNTTDISIIESLLYDRNDDLSIDHYISYWPILMEAHPDTPTDYNQTPTANAGHDQIVFDEITLDGSLSDDPDGEIVSYQWQLIHSVNSAYNRSAEGQTPTISDLKHGFYDVTLVVEDNGGATDTDEMSFSATGLKGDFNFDGNVDGSDLAEFSENFGTTE
jgi:hypothetical protein